jgi:hypothetical protein
VTSSRTRIRENPRGRAFGDVLAGALAGLALLVAGCGGSKAPSVASLGTTGGTSASSAGADGAAGPGARAGTVIFSGTGVLAFSACMRSHGEPDFPDPDGQGAAVITASSGLDLSSPRFQAAEKACGSLMPGSTPAQQAQAQTGALKFSACMRAHGISDFPDPTFSNGSIGLRFGGAARNAPQFLAAQKSCRHDLPGSGP